MWYPHLIFTWQPKNHYHWRGRRQYVIGNPTVFHLLVGDSSRFRQSLEWIQEYKLRNFNLPLYKWRKGVVQKKCLLKSRKPTFKTDFFSKIKGLISKILNQLVCVWRRIPFLISVLHQLKYFIFGEHYQTTGVHLISRWQWAHAQDRRAHIVMSLFFRK